MSVATVNTKEKISCKTEFQAFDHLMKSVKNDADILCCLLQHLWTYTGRHFYMAKNKKIKFFEGIFCTSEIYRIENVPLQGFNVNRNALGISNDGIASSRRHTEQCNSFV